MVYYCHYLYASNNYHMILLKEKKNVHKFINTIYKTKLFYIITTISGIATGRAGGLGGPWSLLTLIYGPNKVQKSQFQTSGILLFKDIQRLYGPEILQVLPSMLQLLDNLLRFLIFLTTQKK